MSKNDNFSKFLDEQKESTSSDKPQETQETQDDRNLQKEIDRLEKRVEELEAENHRKKVKIIKLNKKLSGDVGRR